MACTTILVGKNASYDGSTMIARNDDSGSGHFTPKKFVVVHPDEQPKTYKSVLSHVTIELTDDPMRYTAVPNAVEPLPTMTFSYSVPQYSAMHLRRDVYSLSGYVVITSICSERAVRRSGDTPSGLTFAEKLTISSFLMP